MSRVITRKMLSNQGTFTANGTTGVVFAPTVPLTANSTIIITNKTPAGTPSPAYVSSRTDGAVGTASLTFKASASDTSLYAVTIIG